MLKKKKKKKLEILEAQFSTCNHYLPPDTAGKPPVFLSQLTRSPQLSKTKNPWAKKRPNRASESRAHTVFLRDTLLQKSKESLGMEISSSAGRDALVAQHEICETSRIPWEGVG